MFEVIVGNVGTVHSGDSEREALLIFNTYVDRSKSGHGRCGNEEVTMMEDGDIAKQYLPEHSDISDDGIIHNDI